MDDHGFDQLSRRIGIVVSRRSGLAALVAGAVALLVPAAADDALANKDNGGRDGGREHGRNRPHRPGKHKDNRKGKRQGKRPGKGSTPCIPAGQDGCSDAASCCAGDVCTSANTCQATCNNTPKAACGNGKYCCLGRACENNVQIDQLQCCILDGEECEDQEGDEMNPDWNGFCCAANSACRQDRTCGSCGKNNAPCSSDDDCCAWYTCDSRAGICVWVD